MSFRARFAPSPTGQVHIGNIRTAIFNWLATRHSKGTFLLRIEDTDLERSTKEAIDKLLECMEWLGLDYDEEIVYQTSQLPRHLEEAKKLEAAENAYRLDPAETNSPLLFKLPYDCDGFEFIRQAGPAELKVAPGSTVKLNRTGIEFITITPKGKEAENAFSLAGFKDLDVVSTDGTVLFHLDGEKYKTLSLNPKEKTEIPGAALLKFNRREVFYEDLVKGLMAKPLDSMKDFIIIRSDGSPVFHLANVCDDVTQNVTHIVRGDDHVENTFRHLFIFKLLNFTPPKYAHLPMIVNKAGKPYSKRDGDAFVGDFRAKGFLPEALFNYLSLLGWSPGDDREKMSRQELIDAFTIERALRSPAQFDIQKLTNLNGHYIAELPEEEYLAHVKEFLPQEQVNHPLFKAVAKLMQSRTKTFADVLQWKYFFAAPAAEEYDPKGLKKFLGDPAMRALAEKAAAELEAGVASDAVSMEELFHKLEEGAGLKQGKLNQVIRVAVTGTTIGAGLCETIEVIGIAESVKRIRFALTLPVPEA